MEKYIYRSYLLRLASILKKFSIIGISFVLSLLIFYVLIPVFSAILFVILGFVVFVLVLFWALITLCFVFVPLADEGWRNFPEQIGDIMYQEEGMKMVYQTASKAFPAVLTISFIFLIVALGIYFFNRKDEKYKKSFIKNLVFLICSSVLLIIFFIVANNI